MDLCNDLSCELEVGCHTGVFNQRFEALFSSAGALGCVVCLTPQLFLPVYLNSNEGPPAPPVAASLDLPATALPRVLSTPLPVSAPPTDLDECFFFISLVVRLPYSSIFCQFWWFFVFKLLSFFWLCEEVQCVYLCLHLGQNGGFFQSGLFMMKRIRLSKPFSFFLTLTSPLSRRPVSLFRCVPVCPHWYPKITLV